MQHVSHSHKWTNILAEELSANHHPYAHKIIAGKQANETLSTNQPPNTEAYIRSKDQYNSKMQTAVLVPSTYTSGYLKREIGSTASYLRQAYSIEQKRNNLRQKQVFDSFDHIQQFSYIQQKHHPNNQYCASQIPYKQKHTVKDLQQVRELPHNTPLLFMPPIQPVRTIFQPIPLQTIPQSPPKTYTIIHHTPQAVQKIHTLSQARKMAGVITSANQNMAANHQISIKINTNGSNQQFASAQRTLVSPYQRLNSPNKYQNEWSAQSGVEQIPKIIITKYPDQPDENAWNIPEEDIGRTIIAQTGFWKANLPSTKRDRDNNHQKEEDELQQPPQKLELNESLQIFNGHSPSGDSSLLLPLLPQK